MLLAAAAARGVPGLGIDVSLTWLVVARRMIEQHGGEATLCAAFAESLPPRDAQVPGIVSLDVIEHVADQARYLAEIDRIATVALTIALATPRFSLSAEPHVHVWGVGWIPTRFQARYVRARSGRAYDFVRLLSVPGLFDAPVAPYALCRPLRGTARARRRDRRDASGDALGSRALYNRLADSPLLRWPLLGVGPFFRYTGTARTLDQRGRGDTRAT